MHVKAFSPYLIQIVKKKFLKKSLYFYIGCNAETWYPYCVMYFTRMHSSTGIHKSCSSSLLLCYSTNYVSVISAKMSQAEYCIKEDFFLFTIR